jgi:(methylthio)acryloyl-CoA hydratase
MSAEAVTYELLDNVAWLGLNRPRKRNAIDSRLLAALHESVTRERVISHRQHNACR